MPQQYVLAILRVELIRRLDARYSKRTSNLFYNIRNNSEFKRRVVFNEDLSLVTGSVLACVLMAHLTFITMKTFHFKAN